MTGSLVAQFHIHRSRPNHEMIEDILNVTPQKGQERLPSAKWETEPDPNRRVE